MKPRAVLALLVASAATLSTPTRADASLVFERDEAIWIAADDGRQPRRLAAGIEPHLVPGGAAVLYRSPGGRRLYAVAAPGGPRRLVHSFRVPRRARQWWAAEPLHLQFSADGQRVLASPAEGKTLLVDLAAARVRRLGVPTDVGTLSPNGTQVAWIRDRRSCEIAVLDTGSGKVSVLQLVSCASLVQRGRGVSRWPRRTARAHE